MFSPGHTGTQDCGDNEGHETRCSSVRGNVFSFMGFGEFFLIFPLSLRTTS